MSVAAATHRRAVPVRRSRLGGWALLALLALWAVAPLTLMIIHSLGAGVALTGADGPVAADVLQYLAWVRDGASHGLAADLFNLGPHTHVWLHPMFSLSAAAVALGAGVIAAYLVWTPVAIGALFAAARLWAAELVAPGWGRVAALALALFLNNPLRVFVDANTAAPRSFGSQLVQATSEPFSAGLLWGYLPTVIAIAMMPLCLIAASRALATPSPLPLAGSVLAALLAAWLHPWQGVVLILILAGMWLWRRWRRELWLALPALGAAAPLAYYAALGRYDDAWHTSQTITAHFPHFSAAALLAGLGPLLLAAAFGLGHAPESPLERAVSLWVPAALLAYFVVPYPSHALEGISFPLAVLLVRGWSRARGWLRIAPRGGLAAATALVAIAVLTVPGVIADARDFRNLAHRLPQYFYLRPAERRALDYVAHTAPAGAVLAPLPLATAVPAHTGRAVWVGHSYWTPDFDRRALAVQALFAAALPPSAARGLVARLRAGGASVLVADCEHHADLSELLGAELSAERRVGCATVYTLAPR